MYDVCIADDEALIRQSFTARIRESGMPLRVIGCAANAENALALYWAAKPDIFFVDINMPRMDGLSLIRTIRELDPDCTTKFIIITGYDDFTHLRRAIQRGVMDYLKKPVSTEEFNSVLTAAITQLRQEGAKYEAHHDGYVYYEDCIAEGNKFFNSGVALAFYSPSGELPGKEYSNAIFREASSKLTGTGSFAVSAGGKILFLRFRNAENIVLWHYNDKVIPRKELAAALRPLLNERHLWVVYAYPEGEQIEALVERVERSFNVRFLHSGLDSNLLIEAFGQSTQFSVDTSMLDYALEHGYAEDAAKAVKALVANVSGSIKTIGELCPLYKHIVLLIINKYIDHTIPIPPFLKPDMSHFVLCKYPSLQAICSFLTGTVSSLAAAIGAEHPRGDLIQEIIKYLKQHYKNDITLQSLSKEFFVTAPYLSRRFKEKTDLTFVEYLENLRLDKAKEYLLASDAKIIDITYQVGYQDPNYFAKVFKKKYLLSPSDYRAANRKQSSVL